MKSLEKLLYIDKEAVATLAMARDGLLEPVNALMNEEEAKEVNKNAKIKNCIFPFAFILAPSGKRNNEILKNAKKGEKLVFICDNEICGHIIVDEVFRLIKMKEFKRYMVQITLNTLVLETLIKD